MVSSQDTLVVMPFNTKMILCDLWIGKSTAYCLYLYVRKKKGYFYFGTGSGGTLW